MSNPQDITNTVKGASHLAGKIYAAQAYADNLDYIFRRYKDSLDTVSSLSTTTTPTTTTTTTLQPLVCTLDPVISSSILTILQQILILNHDSDHNNRVTSAQAIQSITGTIIQHIHHNSSSTNKYTNNTISTTGGNTKNNVVYTTNGSTSNVWEYYYQNYFLYPHTEGLLAIDKYDINKVIKQVTPLTAQGSSYWSNLSTSLNPILYSTATSNHSSSSSSSSSKDTVSSTLSSSTNTDELIKKRLVAQRADILRLIGIEAVRDKDNTSVENTYTTVTNSSSSNSSSTTGDPTVLTALKVSDLRSVITDNDLQVSHRTNGKKKKKESITSSSGTTVPFGNVTSITPSLASFSTENDNTSILTGNTALKLPTPIECLQSLYGDVCFYLFDPSWEIRHGSALLLQGLLQGIETLASSPSSNSSVMNHNLSELCRSGLQDILLRCITVLAIDHFVDYSSVILYAPVREIIAQILSTLARYWIIHNLSLDQFGESLLILANHEEWHTRHGCVLGIRAIVLSILNYYYHPPYDTKESSLLSIENPPVKNVLIPITIQTNLLASFITTSTNLLQDNNSDVAQVAGDILYLLSFVSVQQSKQITSCIPTQDYTRILELCVVRLYTELNSPEANSSSSLPVSLLPLIARLIQQSTEFEAIKNGTLSTVPVELIQTMVMIASVYIEHPFQKVRKSSLITLYILTKVIRKLYGTQSNPRNDNKTMKKSNKSIAKTAVADPYDTLRSWFTTIGPIHILSSVLRVIMVDLSFDTFSYRTERDNSYYNCTETSLSWLQCVQPILFPFTEVNTIDSAIKVDIDSIVNMNIVSLSYRILYELTMDASDTTHDAIPLSSNFGIQYIHDWFIRSLSILSIPDGDAILVTNFRPQLSTFSDNSVLNIEDHIIMDNSLLTLSSASSFSKSAPSRSSGKQSRKKSTSSSGSNQTLFPSLQSVNIASWNISISFPSTLNIPMSFIRRLHGCNILGMAFAKLPSIRSIDCLTAIESFDTLHSSFVQQAVSLFLGFSTAYSDNSSSIIRSMQLNQRILKSMNYYFSIHEKELRTENEIILQEMLPSIRELTTAAGNLQAALTYWKNLLTLSNPSMSNQPLVPEQKETKRSRTKINKAKGDTTQDDDNVLFALLDFQQTIHSTLALIIETKTTINGYNETKLQNTSASVASRSERIIDHYEEVLLQLQRTEGLFDTVSRNNRRWKFNGAVALASAWILPFIFHTLRTNQANKDLLPEKLTPIVRTLLFTLHSDVGTDNLMNTFIIVILSVFIRCTTPPSLNNSAFISSSTGNTTIATNDLSMIGSRIFTKLLDTVSSFNHSVPSDNDNAQYKYTVLLLSLFQQHNMLTKLYGENTKDSIFSSLLFSFLPTSSISSVKSTNRSPQIVAYSDGQLLALSSHICAYNIHNVHTNVDHYLATVFHSLCSTNTGRSTLNVVSSLSSGSIESLNVLSSVHQQFFLTAFQFSFYEWIMFYTDTLYPILVSSASNNTSSSNSKYCQTVAMEILYVCLRNSALPVFSSLNAAPMISSASSTVQKVTTVRECFLTYGPIFIAVVLKYFVHPDTVLRSYGSELFRILVQNLPVQLLASSRTTLNNTSRLWSSPPIHWKTSLKTIYLEGLSVARTFAQNASQSLSRMSPSILRNIDETMNTKVVAVTEESLPMNSNVAHSNDNEEGIVPFTIPKEALPSVTLRNYQHEGIVWLNFLRKNGLGGILADDMGLGKTIQILTAIACGILDDASTTNRSEINRGGLSLIICPSSLMHFWAKEIVKFYPPLPNYESFFRVLVYEGTPSQRTHVLQQVQPVSKNYHDTTVPYRHTLLITSYNILRNSIDTLTTVLPSTIKYCILDEAHIVHNPNSEVFKACSRISLVSESRFILTGTPIQNSPSDIWSLFHLCLPGYLGEYTVFHRNITTTVLKARNRTANEDDIRLAETNLSNLHKQISPFLLRRLKGDVLHELPPKIIQDISILLTPTQAELYQAFEQGNYGQELLQYAHSMDDANGTHQSRRTNNYFRSVSILRQICNHPRLLDKSLTDELLRSEKGIVTNSKSKKETVDAGTSSKEDIYTIDDSCKLLALKDLLIDLGFLYSNNHPHHPYPPSESSSGSRSSKRSRTNDTGNPVDTGVGSSTIPTVLTGTTEHKVLIFSQTSKMLDVIMDGLLRNHFPHIKYARIDGQTTPLQRVEIAHQFNFQSSLQVLLLTTAVGGLGLSLIGADTVVFIDHDWNPIRDAQAMDRAHRIGQTRTVNIYRFIAAETLEERIMSLQNMKERMANIVVGTSSSSTGITKDASDTNENSILSLFIDASNNNNNSGGGGSLPTTTKKRGTKTPKKETLTSIEKETYNDNEDNNEEEDYDQIDLATFMNVLRGNQ